MAIPIKRNIKRALTKLTYHYKGKEKSVDVTLTDRETLLFHVRKTRWNLEVDLGYCLSMAEVLSVDAIYRNEMEKYKQGIRKRKPRRLFFPYSPVFLRAIENIKK